MLECRDAGVGMEGFSRCDEKSAFAEEGLAMRQKDAECKLSCEADDDLKQTNTFSFGVCERLTDTKCIS